MVLKYCGAIVPWGQVEPRLSLSLPSLLENNHAFIFTLCRSRYLFNSFIVKELSQASIMMWN